MTNLEYIIENEKELLIGAITKNERIVKLKNGKFTTCENVYCRECIAYNENNCNLVLEEMFEQEYKEPCPFEKDELVEVSENGVAWNLRYFSHIGEKGLFATFTNGMTSKETNSKTMWKYCRKYGTLGGLVKDGDEE